MISFIDDCLNLLSKMRDKLNRDDSNYHNNLSIIYEREECLRGGTFKPAVEDWYPCYVGNLVKIVLHKQTEKYSARISIWGSDDFGMEKTYPSDDAAYNEYRALPVVIFKDDLISRGFKGF